MADAAPMVSIVIPAYNASEHIVQAIDSVAAQTISGWELIVVDDGSTDSTAAVVSARIDGLRNARLISKENQGVSHSRNLGASEAQGSIVAFLDADDSWLPSKLEAHLARMEADPRLAVTFARVEFMDASGRPTGQLTNNLRDVVTAPMFLRTNPTVTTSNVVVRREAFFDVGGFDETINHSEDVELLFRLALNPRRRIQGVDEVLVRYRLHGEGLSADVSKMESGWHAMIEKARTYAPDVVDEHVAQGRAAHMMYWASKSMDLGHPTRDAVDYVNGAIRADARTVLGDPRLAAKAAKIYARHLTRGIVGGGQSIGREHMARQREFT